MNFIKRLILKRLAPKLLARLQDEQDLLRWYADTTHKHLQRLRQQHEVIRAQQAELDQFWQQHTLCRDNLLSLVALNDAGEWTTVFDANEPVTEELGAYLSAVVART